MPSGCAAVKRSAIVVGGGFAGLTAATALALRGWNVTLYERGSEVRAVGSALALSENGLSVLEAIGAYDQATQGAFPLQFRETRDGANRLVSRYDWKTENKQLRMFFLLRSRAINAIANAARSAGVEISLGKAANSADSRGAVTLASGEVVSADLVVGADGANSAIRNSLSIPWQRRLHPEGSIRLLINRASDVGWDNGLFIEYWSGIRRAMLVPCSEDQLYLALIAREEDLQARQVPIDVKAWSASFPHLAPYVARLGPQERWSWDQYQTLRMHSWCSGRVALLGDAAHAMSPNFGQGAALAMVNALTLAAAVDQAGDVPTALVNWQARERWLTDRTQRLSALYSSLTSWPDTLRAAAIWGMGRSRWIMRQRTLAAYYLPRHAAPPALAGTSNGV